jgi:hypothetical protein
MRVKKIEGRVAKLLPVAALVAGGLVGTGAQAAQALGTFSVNVTLTPKCEVVSGTTGATTIPNLALSYTSFQAAATTASTTFYVRCTKSLPYSMSLGTASDVSFSDSSTKLDVVLALSNSSAHSATAAASLTSLAGDGATTGQQYWVHGTVAAGQDGTVTAPNASNIVGNNPRTLTITY